MKKLCVYSSLLAMAVGILLIIGGIWGIAFTYALIAREKIVTPADARIPEKSVRGPFTLKAQADSIRRHTLKTTGGKTFAEMPRQIPELDENGQQILGADGKPVLTANTARDIWITATTFTTALNLGIMTYAFSGLILLFGCMSLWTGIVFYVLSKRGNFV